MEWKKLLSGFISVCFVYVAISPGFEEEYFVQHHQGPHEHTHRESYSPKAQSDNNTIASTPTTQVSVELAKAIKDV